jgi:hypothetical protein
MRRDKTRRSAQQNVTTGVGQRRNAQLFSAYHNINAACAYSTLPFSLFFVSVDGRRAWFGEQLQKKKENCR